MIVLFASILLLAPLATTVFAIMFFTKCPCVLVMEIRIILYIIEFTPASTFYGITTRALPLIWLTLVFEM